MQNLHGVYSFRISAAVSSQSKTRTHGFRHDLTLKFLYIPALNTVCNYSPVAGCARSRTELWVHYISQRIENDFDPGQDMRVRLKLCMVHYVSLLQMTSYPFTSRYQGPQRS